MFEFIKKLFKREETKRIPGVEYVDVDRVPIKRIELKKFEPKRFEPQQVYIETLKEKRADRILRIRYTDTDEIVEKPASEAIREFMGSQRPVVIEGFVK